MLDGRQISLVILERNDPSVQGKCDFCRRRRRCDMARLLRAAPDATAPTWLERVRVLRCERFVDERSET